MPCCEELTFSHLFLSVTHISPFSGDGILFVHGMRDLPWRHCLNLDRWVHLHYRHRTWKGHRCAVPLILLHFAVQIWKNRSCERHNNLFPERVIIVKTDRIVDPNDRPMCCWVAYLPLQLYIYGQVAQNEDVASTTVAQVLFSFQYELEALLKFWNNLSKPVPNMFAALAFSFFYICAPSWVPSVWFSLPHLCEAKASMQGFLH